MRAELQPQHTRIAHRAAGRGSGVARECAIALSERSRSGGKSCRPRPGSAAAPAAASNGPETVYVFNVGSKDVTLIDAAARQARETRPLGASVRWLSNEQTYWDGQLIWTYDFPDNKLQAIGIDPRGIAVARTIPDLGTGPGHSLMLLPDKKTAAINVAGDNMLAVIDVASSEIIRKVPTGKFPCDLHFTPDGRYAYTPERDQDTVSMFTTPAPGSWSRPSTSRRAANPTCCVSRLMARRSGSRQARSTRIPS